MKTQELLRERGATHGEYLHHAEVAQALKRVMQHEERWIHLRDHERETLEMIAHKVARILAGDPHFVDHWADIAGYATLSADRNRAADHPQPEAGL